MQEAQETRVRSLGWEDILEEGMAAHSSILAWRIPQTEEPGGLQSTGSQRVGHSWAHTASSRAWMSKISLPRPTLTQRTSEIFFLVASSFWVPSYRENGFIALTVKHKTGGGWTSLAAMPVTGWPGRTFPIVEQCSSLHMAWRSTSSLFFLISGALHGKLLFLET